ncbi:MAG: ParB/RepB/Spo0J family partition protein [Gemmatimonadetes bacterium]|nr:ParB/RepB/Spo0J family partition protein [Gemmatimonadota bacterium]
MSRPKRERLGKGLGALLGDYLDADPADADIHRLPVGAIAPNPLQPRKEFSEEELAELVESIRENGLLQPLVVRPSPSQAGRYELVAGERRLRSVQRLEWADVPVVVREVDDEALLVLALVENLQREALGPLEEAEGYRTLGERFGLTQDEIARSVGKDRSTVANFLRLLKLPPSVRRLLEEGQLATGHARALLSLEDPIKAAELARRAVREGWSVREVERRVRGGGDEARKRRPASSVGGSSTRDPMVRALEESLRETLATRVTIKGASGGKGVIEVPFHGTEDFERIFALLAGREASEVLG